MTTAFATSEQLAQVPHLWSPAALARADTEGKWQMAPHLSYLNRELMSVAFNPGTKLIVNIPQQHGKSMLSSHYFPAWLLLLFPETRIILVAHEEKFAATFGAKVKDVIDKFGRDAGITIRRDTKSKSEWMIDGHGGGMVCKGVRAGIAGRPADLLLIDDPLKNAEQALSATVSEQNWNWYQTVVEGRLRGHSSIVMVTTRWGRKDLPGRVLDEARRTGEKWRLVKFKALAEKDDPLGRPLGAPLWPENVGLAQFERLRRSRGRWWRACWQQEPEDDEGTWFKPRYADGSWRWPLYTDTGDCYSVPQEGGKRVLYRHHDVIRLITGDCAWKTKKQSNRTSFGSFGVMPDGGLLIFEVMAERISPEDMARELAKVCRRIRPDKVAVEEGHLVLANDYRRHKEIPEIQWLTTGGKSKLQRALSAITLAENSRVYLPDTDAPWMADFASEIAAFTGVGEEEDDRVDVLAYAAKLAEQLRPVARYSENSEPCLLIPGKSNAWQNPTNWENWW